MSYVSARGGNAPSRSRSALERFSQDLDRSFADSQASAAPTTSDHGPKASSLQPVNYTSRVDRATARGSPRYPRASVAEDVPPTSSAEPTPAAGTVAEQRDAQQRLYEREPALRGGRYAGGPSVPVDVSSDIASMNASLKTLAAHCQAMEGKYMDERQARGQLEDYVKHLEREGKESADRLTKLEGALEREVDALHEAGERQAAETRDVIQSLATTMESYNEDVEERVNQLAKTLVTSSRDGKERMEALERDLQLTMAEVTEQMLEQASRMASRVDARFSAERKATSDKWDAVETSLTSKLEPLEQRMVDNRATVMRMMEESNKGHNNARERQQKMITDNTVKLRQVLQETNEATLDQMERMAKDMDDRMGKNVEEMMDLLCKYYIHT